MLVQTLSLRKLIDVLPVPLLGRRQAERRALSLGGGGREPWGGLPIPESGRWIWWERKKIGAHPSSFPSSDPSAIPTSTATAPPRWKRGRHCEERWSKLPPQREFSRMQSLRSGSPHNAGSRPPRESTLHASLPITPNHTTHETVCIPLVWCSVGREEYTICNVICFHPYVPLSLPRLRHTGAFYVAGLVTWQTTVNKTHRTQRFAEWQKANAGCTSHAFKPPGHDVTRPWRVAHRLDWLHMIQSMVSLKAFP